jgi:hypothetical protein
MEYLVLSIAAEMSFLLLIFALSPATQFNQFSKPDLLK